MEDRIKNLKKVIPLLVAAVMTAAMSLCAYAAFSGHTETIHNSFSIAEVKLTAEFASGSEINAAMNNRATASISITAFKHYTETPDLDSLNAVDVSSENSDTAIYMWYNAGTIYWWSLADEVYLNEDSSGMFSGCGYIESIDTSYWNTSNVVNMSYMFEGCSSLSDLDVSEWDTGNVKTMEDIFDGCSSLTEIDMSNWDISSLTNIAEMFASVSFTSLDLSGWDVSHITDMEGIFAECTSLESIDLNGWDVSNVTNMNEMFYGCELLEDFTSLSEWDVSNVETMENIFTETGAYNNYTENGDYSGFPDWYLTSITFMDDEIEYAIVKVPYDFDTIYEDNWPEEPEKDGYNFTQWNTEADGTGEKFTEESEVTAGENLTVYAIWKEKGTAFAIYSAEDGSLTFYCKADEVFESIKNSTTYNEKTVSAIYTGFETIEYISYSAVPWYSDRTKFKSVIFDESFEDARPVAMAYWFYDFTACEDMDLEHANTSKVTTMYRMFYYCSKLESLDLSKWNTSNVRNMQAMFLQCSNLESINLSNLNTKNVTTMYAMFSNCTNLEEITFGKKFNTSNVTTMQTMFNRCSSLEELDLSSFDTSNVKDMYGMFYYCSSLKSLDISKFDTSNVTSMYEMFYKCSSLESLDVSNFNTYKVTDMGYMFFGCSALETIYSDDEKFTTKSVITGTSMFQNCTNLVGGEGTPYSSSKRDYTMAHVDTKDNPGYFTDISKKPKTSSLILDANGGSFEDGSSLIEISLDDSLPEILSIASPSDASRSDYTAGMIELPEPEREGYEFLEWNTDVDGEGDSYHAGDIIEITQMTLYAIWIEEDPDILVASPSDALPEELEDEIDEDVEEDDAEKETPDSPIIEDVATDMSDSVGEDDSTEDDDSTDEDGSDGETDGDPEDEAPDEDGSDENDDTSGGYDDNDSDVTDDDDVSDTTHDEDHTDDSDDEDSDEPDAGKNPDENGADVGGNDSHTDADGKSADDEKPSGSDGSDNESSGDDSSKDAQNESQNESKDPE